MKKLFALLLILTTVAALSICASAASRGTAYIEDNGYYDEKVTEAAPGATVYIALVEAEDTDSDYEVSSSMTPTTARVISAKTESFSEDKDYRLINTGNLDIEKLEVEDGGSWYFAVLEIKEIDLDDYPDDGFMVEGRLKVTRKGGSTFTLDLEDALDAICFSEAQNEDELAKQAQLYTLKSNTEFSLEFPNENGRFSGKARGSLDVLASMSHAKISAITRLERNADMTFYIGNNAAFSNIRDGQLIIEADYGNYLYKIGTSNRLTDVTNTYDEDEDAFVIDTDVLGKYVVSDERLSTSGTSFDDEEDEQDSDGTYIYTEDDEQDNRDDEDAYVSVPLVNPSTGAAV
ncbi:MAG: hypothetical protein ACK5L0_04400 [Candidatus Fimivivens sp.]